MGWIDGGARICQAAPLLRLAVAVAVAATPGQRRSGWGGPEIRQVQLSLYHYQQERASKSRHGNCWLGRNERHLVSRSPGPAPVGWLHLLIWMTILVTILLVYRNFFFLSFSSLLVLIIHFQWIHHIFHHSWTSKLIIDGELILALLNNQSNINQSS